MESTAEALAASEALDAFIVDSFEQSRLSTSSAVSRPPAVETQLDYFSDEIHFAIYGRLTNRFANERLLSDRPPSHPVFNPANRDYSAETTSERRTSSVIPDSSFSELLPSADVLPASALFSDDNIKLQPDEEELSTDDGLVPHVGKSATTTVATRSSAWMKFDPNRIVGLINTGTNCHANSVIQCLVRCEPLRVWVLTSRPRKCHRPAKRDFCCFCALRAVFRRFATAEQAFYGARNLIRGLSALTSVNFTDESDANEFALLLLENASSHHKNYHKDRNISRLPNSVASAGPRPNADRPSNLAWIDRIRDFSDLFTLKIKRKFQCVHCKESSSVIETHPVIHLPSVRRAVLVKQLQQFMYQRYPGRKCPSCRKYIQQKTFVKYRPPVLIVAIPRVTTCMRKTNQRFVYGRKVSLEFADRIRSSSPVPFDRMSRSHRGALSLKSTYDLCTIITHTGNESTTGHYSAIVRSKPSRWHFVSDEAHYRLRANEVFSRNDATLLFYVTDFAKPRVKRPAALRVSNRNQTNPKKEVLFSKNSNALEEHHFAENTIEPTLKNSEPAIPEKCGKEIANTVATKRMVDEENDENCPGNVKEHVDLSLPAPASSLLKLGCENCSLKQLVAEPEWENLDAPRPRKRSKRHRPETIYKAFHEFVHSEH